MSAAAQTREREKEQQFAMFGLFANTGTQAAMSVTNGTAGFTVNFVGPITHISGNPTGSLQVAASMTAPTQLGGGTTGPVLGGGVMGLAQVVDTAVAIDFTASTSALIDTLTAATAVLGTMLAKKQGSASSTGAARSDSTGTERTVLTARDRDAFMRALDASEPTAALRDIMTLVP